MGILSYTDMISKHGNSKIGLMYVGTTGENFTINDIITGAESGDTAVLLSISTFYRSFYIDNLVDNNEDGNFFIPDENLSDKHGHNTAVEKWPVAISERKRSAQRYYVRKTVNSMRRACWPRYGLRHKSAEKLEKLLDSNIKGIL